MKKKLVFATNNAHKLLEVREILKDYLEVLSLQDIGCFEDIEETGSTLEENAKIKAEFIKSKYGYDCFADDTGLEVEALGGLPGVKSARYAGDENNSEANIKKLLSAMADYNNREARFRTVIALILGDEIHFFEGIVNGNILLEKKGDGGFGYDPVFSPNAYNGKSFAELGNEIKNDISHRSNAVKKLATYLIKN